MDCFAQEEPWRTRGISNVERLSRTSFFLRRSDVRLKKTQGLTENTCRDRIKALLSSKRKFLLYEGLTELIVLPPVGVIELSVPR